MNVAEAIARLETKVDGIARLFNRPMDERGGVELALEILPYSSTNYIYQLARIDKIPYRKVGHLYEFSRRELEAWKDAGSPQPAMQWAKEYRERLNVESLGEAA